MSKIVRTAGSPSRYVPCKAAVASRPCDDGARTAVGVGSERRRDHPRPPRSTRRSRRASTPTSPRARPAAPDESSRSRDRPWAPEPRSQSHSAATIYEARSRGKVGGFPTAIPAPRGKEPRVGSSRRLFSQLDRCVESASIPLRRYSKRTPNMAISSDAVSAGSL